ncbi:amidase, partial [Burkholderia pseudomallei]
MKRLGAVVIDPVDLPKADYEDDAKVVLLHEFKHGLPSWLRTFAPHSRVRTLADVIAFNARQHAREMPYFGQELLLHAQE